MTFFAPLDDDDLYATLEDEEFPPIDYEIPEEWEGLRQEMNELENEYVKCRRELFAMTQKVHQTYESIEKLQKNINVFETPLKDTYIEIFEQFKIESKIDIHVQDIRKLIGKRNAMKIILKIKNEEKLCPVCCESEVACFIDPCGHTFCRTCLNMDKCPICRTNIKQIRQLFFS